MKGIINRIMQYKVKKQTKIPYAIAIVAAALSVAFLYTSNLGLGGSLMHQIIMLVCAGTAGFVLIRYVLTDYIYVISDEKPYTLEIVTVCGKYPKTVARFEMSASDKLICLQKGEKADCQVKGGKRENFCSNMFPTQRYVYVTKVDSSEIRCTLELDKQVADLLSERINELGIAFQYE